MGDRGSHLGSCHHVMFQNEMMKTPVLNHRYSIGRTFTVDTVDSEVKEERKKE